MNIFINVLSERFAALNFSAVLQLCIISVGLFFAFRFLRCRRAFPVLIGTLAVYLLYIITGVSGLTYIHDVLKLFVSVGPVVLLLVFATEIRTVLEEIGNALTPKMPISHDEATANEVIQAVADMSKNKTGAIIILENKTLLDNITEQAEYLDANVSSKLLLNIFAGKAPLHDGAVLIRNNRVYYAGCKLPMSSPVKLGSEYGARHQATINLSVTCDAVTIVVSEEDGTISFVERGELYHLTLKTFSNVILSAMGVKGHPASERMEAAKLAEDERKAALESQGKPVDPTGASAYAPEGRFSKRRRS